MTYDVEHLFICLFSICYLLWRATFLANFTSLFLAVLGLHCCEGLSLVAVSREEEWRTKVNDHLVSLAYSMCSYILKG